MRRLLAAGSARGWWDIVNAWRGKSAGLLGGGSIGARLFPDSGMLRLGFTFGAWRPPRTARIAPGECLPGIVRGIFFIARYIGRDLPASRTRSNAAMDCNCAMLILAPRCVARRRAISRSHRSCEIAGHILKRS